MKALEALEKRTRSNWKHLQAARVASGCERTEITAALDTFSTADASIVVVGSLAREEFTTESDID